MGYTQPFRDFSGLFGMILALQSTPHPPPNSRSGDPPTKAREPASAGRHARPQGLSPRRTFLGLLRLAFVGGYSEGFIIEGA